MDKDQKNLEEKLKNILSLVKECPEKLQEKCFELLFNYMISQNEVKNSSNKTNGEDPKQDDKLLPIGNSSGDEIKLTDLHTKAKAFLKNYNVIIEDINNLFYKEGDDFLFLFDDLKTTKMADSQVKLALLSALKNSLKTGEFEFSVEGVRGLCDTHKCYDKNNFSSNFRNSKSLFSEEYKKGLSKMDLSADGKKELAKIISEISHK